MRKGFFASVILFEQSLRAGGVDCESNMDFFEQVQRACIDYPVFEQFLRAGGVDCESNMDFFEHAQPRAQAAILKV